MEGERFRKRVIPGGSAILFLFFDPVSLGTLIYILVKCRRSRSSHYAGYKYNPCLDYPPHHPHLEWGKMRNGIIILDMKLGEHKVLNSV